MTERVYESKDVTKIIYFSDNGNNTIVSDNSYERACKVLRDLQKDYPSNQLRKEPLDKGGFEKWYIDEDFFLKYIPYHARMPKYYSVYLNHIDENGKLLFEENHLNKHIKGIEECKEYRDFWINYTHDILTGNTLNYSSFGQVMTHLELKSNPDKFKHLFNKFDKFDK